MMGFFWNIRKLNIYSRKKCQQLKFFLIAFYRIEFIKTRQFQADWEITREFFKHTGLVYFALEFYFKIIIYNIQNTLLLKNFYILKPLFQFLRRPFFWVLQAHKKIFLRLFEARILDIHVFSSKSFIFLRQFIHDQFDRALFWGPYFQRITSKSFFNKKWKQENHQVDDDEN